MNTPSYFAVDDIVMLTPEVALDLQYESVQESNGANATMARVEPSRQEIQRNQSNSQSSLSMHHRQSLPTSVTIPAGVNHVDFPIGVIDNSRRRR